MSQSPDPTPSSWAPSLRAGCKPQECTLGREACGEGRGVYPDRLYPGSGLPALVEAWHFARAVLEIWTTPRPELPCRSSAWEPPSPTQPAHPRAYWLEPNDVKPLGSRLGLADLPELIEVSHTGAWASPHLPSSPSPSPLLPHQSRPVLYPPLQVVFFPSSPSPFLLQPPQGGGPWKAVFP